MELLLSQESPFPTRDMAAQWPYCGYEFDLQTQEEEKGIKKKVPQDP